MSPAAHLSPPSSPLCLNNRADGRQTAERYDAFGLPLCIVPGHRLLHTAPCERHHKSAGLSIVSAGVKGEMEDEGKKTTGEGRGE